MKKLITIIAALFCILATSYSQQKKTPPKVDISKFKPPVKKDSSLRDQQQQPPKVKTEKFKTIRERDSLKRLNKQPAKKDSSQ